MMVDDCCGLDCFCRRGVSERSKDALGMIRQRQFYLCHSFNF